MASEQSCAHERQQLKMALGVLPHDLHQQWPKGRIPARLETGGQPLEVRSLLFLEGDEQLEAPQSLLADSGIGLTRDRGHRHAPGHQILEGENRLSQVLEQLVMALLVEEDQPGD